METAAGVAALSSKIIQLKDKVNAGELSAQVRARRPRIAFTFLMQYCLFHRAVCHFWKRSTDCFCLIVRQLFIL